MKQSPPVAPRLEPKPYTHWLSLVSSGKTDLDIETGPVHLNDALFLFAYRKLEGAKKEELQAIWQQHAKYWRKRLEPAAWKLVYTLCLQRAKEDVKDNGGGGEGAGLKRQMNMGKRRTP